MSNTRKKIKCILPKNSIFYECTPSLKEVWKKQFNGTTRNKGKYRTVFKLNNKIAILNTDKDTSLTQLIYNSKHMSVNLESNPYKVLLKIKNLLSK